MKASIVLPLLWITLSLVACGLSETALNTTALKATPEPVPDLSEGIVSNVVEEEFKHFLTRDSGQGPLPVGAIACFQSDATSEIGFSYAAWSPDAKYLATVLGEVEFGPVKGSKIILWDIATLKPQAILKGQTDKIYSIAWSPSGNRLASGSSERRTASGYIHVWDTATNEPVYALALNTGWPDILVWSPDGTRVATKAGGHGIIIWNVDTGEVLNTLGSHEGRILSLAWSPDGASLASGSLDHTVVIWDADTGERLRTLDVDPEFVNSLVWTPDGLRLVSRPSGEPFKIWDVLAEERIQTLEVSEEEKYDIVTWSPDGSLLASGMGINGSIIIWDGETGKRLNTLSDGHDGIVGALAWSPQSTWLASGSTWIYQSIGQFGPADGTLCLWDITQ